MAVIADFFDKVLLYNEKFGSEDTVVFYQVGSFYETYQHGSLGKVYDMNELIPYKIIEDKHLKICPVCKITNCNEIIKAYGIPCDNIESCLTILKDINVIIFPQVKTFIGNKEIITRPVPKIHLAGSTIKLQESEHYFVCVSYYKDVYSFAALDIITQIPYITETSQLGYIMSLLERYKPKLLLEYNCKLPININVRPIITDFQRIYTEYNYQNECLKRIYTHINFGFVEPIEYFHLTEHNLLAFIMLCHYFENSDDSYIKNLCNIQNIQNFNQLDLSGPTISQLNIQELFEFVNCTKTKMGERTLKSILYSPFTDSYVIKKRLDDATQFIKLDISSQILNILSNIYDISMIINRASKDSITFYYIDKFIKSIYNIEQLIYITNKIYTFENYDNFNLLKLECSSKFSSEVIEINEHKIIFKDDEELNNLIQTWKNIHTSIHNLDDKIKLEKRDNRYTYSCTTSKWKTMNKKQYININSLKSKTFFETKELSDKNDKLELLTNKIERILNLKYKEICKFILNHKDTLKSLEKWISKIDILNSNALFVKKYPNYSCPEIDLHSENYSYIKVDKLRHPLIEKNIKTTYVPHTFTISPDESMLLYGINGSGKSTILRSLAISVVLAQSGLFVPCNSLILSPYKTLICQVNLIDDPLRGHSSFMTEILSLKNIVEKSNKNTLVLADEIVKGTEQVAAESITVGILYYLIEQHSSFIITSHIHNVINHIIDLKQIKIYHIDTPIYNDIIEFKRELVYGIPEKTLYGLKIAKQLGLQLEIILKAYETQKNILNGKNELSIKKSKYNPIILKGKCQICEYSPIKKTDVRTDTHHIIGQCNADENHQVISQYGTTIHKNDVSNLVELCKSCHEKVHRNEIIISGYKMTSKGRILDYTLI